MFVYPGASRGFSLCDSAAAERLYDFDPIAFVQPVRGMASARNDLAIDLHRDPTPGEVALFEQFRDGNLELDATGFAVEEDVHADSVARDVAPPQWARLVTMAAS